jgi:hypothetical protein
LTGGLTDTWLRCLVLLKVNEPSRMDPYHFAQLVLSSATQLLEQLVRGCPNGCSRLVDSPS